MSENSLSIVDHAARATPEAIARRVRGLSDRAILWLFISPTMLLLLAIIGFVIMLQWLKKLAEQLSNILVELRDIGKDTKHMLRVINEEIERNTAEVSAVHSARSG